jgi:hypothetical protein
VNRLRGGLLFAAAALCLCGCAARNVTPVAMEQPGDDQLSCPEIAAQLKTDRQDEAEFARKDREVAQTNVAKNVAAVVVPGLGLTTDLSNVEQVKARSLADRIDHLTYLAKTKGCTQ